MTSGTRDTGEPVSANQPMPSCTRSMARVYVPDAAGETYARLSVADAPGATFAPSPVRLPSHTTAFPAASKMWYARFTGLSPVTSQGTLPVFVTVTASVFASAQYAETAAAGVKVAAKRVRAT